MPFADYARHLLCIAETVHRWLDSLSVLDGARRLRVAGYAERIAATLARAGEALHRVEELPADRNARERAIRELGRIIGYVETMVGALEHHLDGRKLAGVKRRLEQLRPEVRRIYLEPPESLIFRAFSRFLTGHWTGHWSARTWQPKQSSGTTVSRTRAATVTGAACRSSIKP